MESYFNNMSLVQIFLKWKWHLVVIIIIAGLIGVVISSPIIMKPRYKSFAIVYPANLTPYSEESETEQMLQWFASRDIMDSIIVKFDLYDHYEIQPDQKHSYTYMQQLFEKNVRINKTKFESVSLDVTDTDPIVARDMVYSIIDYYNKKVNYSHREKYLEVLKLEEERLLEKKLQLDSLNLLITSIRETYGLLDYGIQASEVTRGYLGTFDGSNNARVNMPEVQRLKSSIQSKGDSLLLVTNLLGSVTAAYTNYLISYEAARRNVTKELTYATIVTHPVVADKKSFPIRWLIVLYSVITIAFLSVIAIGFIENSRAIDERIRGSAINEMK